MDELDGVMMGVCVAALAVAVLLLAHKVRELETDIELVRMAAPVGTGE
jgi:hypothetical protein